MTDDNYLGGADFIDYALKPSVKRILDKSGLDKTTYVKVKATYIDSNGAYWAYVLRPQDSTVISVRNPRRLFLLPGEEVALFARRGIDGDSYIDTYKQNPVSMEIDDPYGISGTTLTLVFTSPYTDVALTDYIYSTLKGEFRFSKTGQSNQELTGTIDSVVYSTSGGYPNATATITLDSAGSVTDTSWTLFSTYIYPAVATGGGGSGTVTSVAISGSDGIEVDSGSPITSAGTIALGVNKTTLLSHINVEDGAQVNNIADGTASGQIPIWDDTAGQYDIATLTEGSNITITNNDGAITIASSGGGREIITADRTYYISPTGSDSNDGLTTGTPFLTIQKGLNQAAAIDSAIYNVIIDLYSATGTGTVTYTEELLPIDLLGSGSLTILGSASNRDNVILQPSDTAASKAIETIKMGKTLLIMQDFKINLATATASNYNYAVFGNGTNKLIVDGLHIVGGLGSGVGDRGLQISTNSIIEMYATNNNMKFSGQLGYPLSIGANTYFTYINNQTIDTSSLTLFITFIDTSFGAKINWAGVTASATAITGKKWSVIANSVLRYGAAIVPGNTAGTTATGGIVY